MFKKIMAIVLVVALTATISIAGTMAYLQDEDSDVNVMTLGNVYIEQHEYQRAEGVGHTNTKETPAGETDLVPFEQKQGLYPAVPKNNAATDYSAEQTDLFYWGDYVFSGTAGNGLWNDAKLSNVMDKFVFVENTGKSDAYFRTIIAFECPEGMEYSEGPDKEFMMNVNGSTLYTWENVGYITVDDVRYWVEVATYQNALKPGNQAHPSLLQVVMTHNATNEDMALLGGTYEILTLSQAVQVEGFTSAATALDTAFGDANETNAAAWFQNMKANPFAVVTTLGKNDVLTNADGDVNVVEENLTIDTTGSKMGLDVAKVAMDVLYQFEPLMSMEEGAKSEYADWHADFVVSVNKDIPAYGIGLAGYYDAWCSLNNDKWVMLASDAAITKDTEIRLVDAMGGGSITVSYEELCNYGNDGIGFLCGAVDLGGKVIDGNTVAQITPGTTLTVELRLYEATDGSRDSETGEYITTGSYTYTFN